LISCGALLNNLEQYQKAYPNVAIAPVLKANAYGHGLVEVAEILEKKNLPFFVLDSMHEAMILRNSGIKTKILLIGHTRILNIETAKIKNTSFTITSLEQLEELDKILSSKRDIHLKIDTGMHRQGVLPDDLDRAIKIIKENRLINLEGVCSHLADAEKEDSELTEKQIEQWERAVGLLKKEFSNIKFFHLSSTAGSNLSSAVSANVLRIGLGLYGIDSSPEKKLELIPALELVSIISSVREIASGEKVGYGATFVADKPTEVATVPVGYFEGVDRRLSNRGFLKVGDKFCKIVGRVSMNITSIDVSDVDSVRIGNKVSIISARPEDENSVENIARVIDSIPWVILVHIPQGLRRVVVV